MVFSPSLNLYYKMIWDYLHSIFTAFTFSHWPLCGDYKGPIGTATKTTVSKGLIFPYVVFPRACDKYFKIFQDLFL